MPIIPGFQDANSLIDYFSSTANVGKETLCNSCCHDSQPGRNNHILAFMHFLLQSLLHFESLPTSLPTAFGNLAVCAPFVFYHCY